MGRFFSLDSPVMNFLGRVADLVWLNILYIICCIPIVTIGASTSALYYVTMKMVADEEGYITKSFFKSFKENFKQATVIWLIILLAGTIFFMDFRILNAMEGTLDKVVYVLICAVAILFLFMTIYIFPLLAKFENTIKNSMKNAFLISIRHFPYTILLVIGVIAPFILIYFVTALLPILFLGIFSLIAFYTSYIYRKIFSYYIPQEEAEADNEEETPSDIE